MAGISECHMTERIRTAVLAGTVIAVLSVAGCGGDEGHEGPSTQEFIAQADAICQVEQSRGPQGCTARTSAIRRSCRGTTR